MTDPWGEDSVAETEALEFNLGEVEWDEGSDNPFGLDPGIYEGTIAEVELVRGKAKEGKPRGQLGLWLTCQDSDSENTIRRWVSLPEKDVQTRAEYKRNISYLRVINNDLEIPQSRWNKLSIDDYQGLPIVFEVTKQKKNPEYNQVSKMSLKKEGVGDMPAFDKSAGGSSDFDF